MRLAAGVAVVEIFFGLGYVKKTNLMGLSGLLETQLAFFAAAFIMVGMIAGVWIIYTVGE